MNGTRFRLRQRTARITFEDGDFAGAEVRMELDRPIGEVLLVYAALNQGRFDELCDLLGAAVVDWNIDDQEGRPLPSDKAGVLKLPLALVVELAKRWGEAQTAIPGPLGGQSPAGNGSVEASIPMEPL